MMLRLGSPLLLMLIAFTGCSGADEQPPQGDTDNISVSFRLKAGNATDTRAVDEEGTPAESYIDLENLKILIFDENQKLFDVIYNNGEMESGTSLLQTAPGMYVVRTKLNPARYNINSEFAVVALANWKSKEDDSKFTSDWKDKTIDKNGIGSLSIDDLKQMVFTLNPQKEGSDQPDSWMPGEGKWIPMFGSRYTTLRGYDSDRFGEANPMPIPDVDLVRAVSKIRIINKDTEYGPTIESIELVHRNQKGSLMQDYDFKGATANVTAPTTRNESAYTNFSIPFHQRDNEYTLYIPEMTLDGPGTRQAICVNLDMNGIKHQKWIYLAPYKADGTPNLSGTYGSDWDSIKRNYVYEYTINSLAFEFLVSVDAWKFGGKVHIPLE